jgi:hypothetical protein
VSIHADDEFSLRIALESELDDVVPSDGLAGLVIARHRKIRRRRVAGVVSLVVVCAGIGIPLCLSGPSGKPSQHNPGHRTDQHTGSTLIPHARAVGTLVIDLPAPSRHRRRGGPPMPDRTGRPAISSPVAAAAVSSGWKERDGPATVTGMNGGLKDRLAA